MHKKYALLGNCTVQDAQQKISEFSRRYTNYQLNKQKNIWAFCIVSEKSMGLIVQIIDKTFEPTRGRVTSDQPYICICFMQVGDDVKLSYWLKWKKWKQILVASGAVIYFAISLAIFHMSTLGDKHFIGSLGLLCGGLCVFLAWLLQNIRHDRLTLNVFRELLYKNFSEIQFFCDF